MKAPCQAVLPVLAAMTPLPAVQICPAAVCLLILSELS